MTNGRPSNGNRRRGEACCCPRCQRRLRLTPSPNNRQRRGRDSNPRGGLSRQQHFQCCSFSRSDTSPEISGANSSRSAELVLWQLLGSIRELPKVHFIGSWGGSGGISSAAIVAR